MTTTKPKERGLVFKDWEVRAIQEGRKTQKRVPIKQLQDDQGREFMYRDGRVWASLKEDELAPLKNDPPKTIFGGEVVFDEKHAYTPVVVGKGPNGEGNPLTSPFGQVGDLLYVREAWRPIECVCQAAPLYLRDGCKECGGTGAVQIDYRSDHPNEDTDGWGWEPSSTMPKWAARIWLEVTDVWVEQIRQINSDGLSKEGFPKDNGPMRDGTRLTSHGRQLVFAEHWDKENPQCPFDSDPWVWVPELEMEGRNA